MFDPVTMLAAFAPTLVKLFDAGIQRFVVPDVLKPTTAAEAVALANVDLDRLRIITQADTGPESYRWVEALRKMQRPIVVYATLTAFLINPEQEAVSQLFQVVMWYLFGERITPTWKGRAK
jgi:hypothetical protein